MILYRRYIGNEVFSLFDTKLYQLVFEHNFSTSKCFNNLEEAKNISTDGKFSILYDLNSTKYLMADNFRYFIIEYPLLNIINAWKQTNSPTEELERSGITKAIGFYPIFTESSNGWGGLLHTTLPEKYAHEPTTYLDGTLGNIDWWYSIGMLCNFPSIYYESGIPSSPGVNTKRVSLWCAIGNSQVQFNIIKYSCICSKYSYLTFVSMAFIFICT